MTYPQPGVPTTANPVITHWACVEIDHTDHPLVSLCGELMELTHRDPATPPEHLCSICQLLAPHHSVNCQGCAIFVRRWGLGTW